MIQAFILEWAKLRRKRLILMMTLFLSAEMLWAFMSISISMSRNGGSVPWTAVLATAASMNGLFLPMMSAIAASRLGDMEHKGNTWKLLFSTSIRPSRLYLAKYACACTLMLYYLLAQTAAIAGFGLLYHFADPMPVALLLRFVTGSLIATMAVLALQQWLSLAVRNQSFALCLGMLGGFIGMTADFFPAFVRRLLIWSYYSGLSPVIVRYTGQAAEYVIRPVELGLPAATMILSAIVYIAGSVHVSRREL